MPKLYATKNDLNASKLTESRAGISEGHQHVDALSTALATYGKLARAAIDEASELGDADTADIFTEISRGGGQVAVVRRGTPRVESLSPVVVWGRPWRCHR